MTDIPAAIPFRPYDLTSSRLLGVADVMYQADRAWRNNRAYQRMMLHDPDLLQAITLRTYTTALLPWKIIPEDSGDAVQRAQCEAIQRSISRIRGLTNMIRSLAEACFYGNSGVWLDYRRADEPIRAAVSADPDMPDGGEEVEAAVTTAPQGYTPIHPDTLLWTTTGNLAIRVNAYLIGNIRALTTVEGPAVVLSPDMRASVVAHAWGREGPEYDDVTTAARVYSGRGLRDRLWYTWLNKQEISQAASHYAERLARGVTMIRYGSGDAALRRAEEIARSMTEAYVVLVPATDESINGKEVEIIEPSGVGFQVFDTILSTYRKSIDKAVLHSELVTGTAPTGLGSGVAEIHQRTFADVVQLDAKELADSLTSDLVNVIKKVNFPDQGAWYRWEFAITGDYARINQAIETADRLTKMGVRLSEREIRSAAGYKEPKADEPTIGGDAGGGIADLSAQIGAL